MDAPSADPERSGPNADDAAEKLRVLRARADEALGVQRSQLGSIEAELSALVEKLAAEYGAGAAGQGTAVADALATTQSRVRLAAAEQYAAVLEKQLTKEIAERQAQLALRDKEKSELEARLAQLAHQINAERNSGGVNAEQLQATHRDLSAALAALRDELTGLEEQLDAQQSETAEARKSATDLQRQLLDARQELDDARAECESLERYCDVLRMELTTTAGNKGSSEALVAQLRVDLAAAEMELADLRAAAPDKNALAAEQAARTKAEAESKRLAAVVAERDAQLATERKAAAATGATLADLQLKYGDAEQQLAALRDERDALQQSVESVGKATSEAEARTATLKRELDDLRAATVPRDRVERLERELAVAAKQAADAAAALTIANDEASQLRRDRDGQQQAAAKTLQEKSVEAARVAELERELAALAASTVSRTDADATAQEVQAAHAARQAADAARQTAEAALAAAEAALVETKAARIAAEQEAARKVADAEQLAAKVAAETAAREAAQARAASLEKQLVEAEAASVLKEACESHLSAAVAAQEEAAQLAESLKDAEGELSAAREEFARLKAELAAAEATAIAPAELAAAKSRAEEAEEAGAAAETQLSELRELLSRRDDELEHARTTQATLEARCAAQKSELAAAADSCLEAVAALEATQRRFDEFAAKAVTAETISELERKCDVALADVQKLKRENSQLREELASRPAVDEGESPDLIDLRSERDELLARIASLEEAAPNVSPDDVQHLADLERRFEMAIDDLRQVKEENARLKSQLTAAPAPSRSAAGLTFDGPLDWAAQRAQLLAMLEEEDADGVVAPARRSERATIEGTISVTDEALAAKDREIAKLKSELAELEDLRETLPAQTDPLEAALGELFDADEAIRAERERLATLQSQWTEKLRQAELELSVQRATLAREQAALREKQTEMERITPPPTPAAEADGKPKRRWFSAMGLGEDEA